MAKNEHIDIQNVTIETVDLAIHAWFDRTVDAHVEHPNGERKKVPVTFSSGERFVTARERKGMRDKNGVIILPMISIRRSGIDPQPTMQALGSETPRLSVAKRVSGKTNSLMNLNITRQPSNRMVEPVVYEVTSIPFPDRSIMTYEVMVQTQYITQMNAVLEKVFHVLDLQKSFVAPFENSGRHPHSTAGTPFEERSPLDSGYVVGFFDANLADASNFEEFTDQERIVRYTTSISVPTTLQLDPEGSEPALKVERTAFGLDFGDERVCFVEDLEAIEKIFGK